MVLDMIDPVHARNRADRTHDQQVIEEVVMRRIFEESAMQAVMTDDGKRIISGSHNNNGESDCPP